MKDHSMRRQLSGMVVSSKMDKTIVVQVERLTKHQLYKKYIRIHNKFSAHDANNSCRVGDKVVITETRPISKTKRWRVSSILEKAV